MMSSKLFLRKASLRALSSPRQLPQLAGRSSRVQAFTQSTQPSVLGRPQLSKQTSLVPLANFNVIVWKRNYAIDRKSEEEIGKRKLEVNPAKVSLGSSTSHITSLSSPSQSQTSMTSGVKQDFETVKETFSVQEVPKEVLNIGLLGTLPYLATSISSAYLAWDINYSINHGVGFLVSGETAEWLLHTIQPVQVGYGAMILSFLGAIHWGLEFAGYGGYHYYKRYAIGVLATAVAWPTVLLPVEYALISQFLAFTVFYFVDTNAARHGWAPPWYSIYRFILTFIVGASIVLTLVSRGEIFDKSGKMPSPTQKLQELKDKDWEALEKEETQRLAALSKENEESSDEKKDADEDEGQKDKKDGDKKEEKDDDKQEKKGDDKKKKKDDDKKEEKDDGKKEKKDGDKKEKKDDDTEEKGDSKKDEDESKDKDEDESKEKSDKKPKGGSKDKS